MTNYRGITIDGVYYASEKLRRNKPDEISQLEHLFEQDFGKNSFQVSLAEFLAEWFSDDPLLKVHTSGSTGTPKELMVEKERMVNSAQMTIDFLGLKKGDSALLCMPLPYIAGKMVVVRAIVGQLNLLVVSPSSHPLKGLSTIPTFAAMVPLQVSVSLKEAAENKMLQAVKELIIGGGAIDKELEDELVNFPNQVWSTYGMTETLSHIALRALNGPNASHWYTPFNGVRLSLSAGQALVIEAPLVSGQILHTNDLAEIDKEGNFRILGRKDNAINTGGIKVQIEEVENKLREVIPQPFLITSAPDHLLGERIVLLITDENEELNGNEWKQRFELLPPYWRPKEILRVTSLPQTETGKPDRCTAREMARRLSKK